MCLHPHLKQGWGWYCQTCLSPKVFLLTIPMRDFFCGSFLLFMIHVCLWYAVLSISCSLVITCWERADFLALLCIVFSCVFVTFPYGVLGQVWYLIVSIPDLCLPLYFYFIGYLHFLKTLKKRLNLNIKVVNMTRNAAFTEHRPTHIAPTGRDARTLCRQMNKKDAELLQPTARSESLRRLGEN